MTKRYPGLDYEQSPYGRVCAHCKGTERGVGPPPKRTNHRCELCGYPMHLACLPLHLKISCPKAPAPPEEPAPETHGEHCRCACYERGFEDGREAGRETAFENREPLRNEGYD